MREGLRLLIEQERDLEVVGELGSLRESEELDIDTDVILTEAVLPDARGKDVISGFLRRFGSASILVLTLLDHPARVQSIVAAGARGYVLKTATATEVLYGIRAVAHGDTYLQPSLGVALARWHGPDPARGSGTDRLSPTEEDVLGRVARGHTNAEIARQIGVSVRTVETHRARIQQKLGRRTRAGLVQYALEAGIIDLDTD